MDSGQCTTLTSRVQSAAPRLYEVIEIGMQRTGNCSLQSVFLPLFHADPVYLVIFNFQVFLYNLAIKILSKKINKLIKVYTVMNLDKFPTTCKLV